MEKYFLKNSTSANEGRSLNGCLLVSDGIIEVVQPAQMFFEVSENYLVMDLSGLTLMPGVFDHKVYICESRRTHKGGNADESRAAVAGGVPSFVEMPKTNPQTIPQAELEKIICFHTLSGRA